MTRTTLLNSPFLLGFDEVEKALERAARNGAEGYPPYNVERLPTQAGQAERVRISVAVAGFSTDQLDVTQEESQLVIRGIAARQFQRSFLLAEGMEVLGAELDRGILSIDLARPEQRRSVRRIAIAAKD